MIDSNLRRTQLPKLTRLTDGSPRSNAHDSQSDTENRDDLNVTRSASRQLTARGRLVVWTTLAAVLVVVAVAAGFARAVSPEAAREVEASRILPVRTLNVVPATSYQVVREYTGTIVARQTTELGFEVAGKVTAIHVEEGDRVAAGAELAQLDTQRLETKRQQLVARRAQASSRLDEMLRGPRDEAIAAAEAKVDSLKAQVKLLSLQTERQEKLLDKNATTRDAYDEFVYGLQARRAQLDEAGHVLEELLNGTRQEQIAAQRAVVEELEASVAEVDVDLGKSRLVAPFAGTIARRLTDNGRVVQIGQPILRLVEDDQLEAWIGLPVPVASTVSSDTPHRLTIGGRPYMATISGRFPEIDAATRTRTVTLKLDNSAAEEVVQGQVVRLQLDESVEESGYWLPSTALTKASRGLWTTFVAVWAAEDERDFRVERRAVEVLHTESGRVFVRGTLNPGDRVIKAGTHRVVPGQRVRPMED